MDKNKTIKRFLVGGVLVVIIFTILLSINIPSNLLTSRNNERYSNVTSIGERFLQYSQTHSEFPSVIPSLTNSDPIKGCNYFLNSNNNGCINAFDDGVVSVMNSDYSNLVQTSNKKEYFLALTSDKKHLYVINNSIEGTNVNLGEYHFRQF